MPRATASSGSKQLGHPTGVVELRVVDRELLALQDHPHLSHGPFAVDDVEQPGPLAGVGDELLHLLAGDIEVDEASDAAPLGDPLHDPRATVRQVEVVHGLQLEHEPILGRLLSAA